MHREPSDNELVDWLHGHQQLSIPALRESILAKAEPWCVSVKVTPRARNFQVRLIFCRGYDGFVRRRSPTLLSALPLSR
jgi:hypothetical protein